MLERGIERPVFIGTFHRDAHPFIKASGLTFVADVAGVSHERRVRAADKLLSSISAEERKKLKGVWIIDDFPNILIDSAQDLIAKGKSSTIFARELAPKLIVIELGSKESKNYVDKKTGIRVRRITDAEIKEALDCRVHPTPDA